MPSGATELDGKAVGAAGKRRSTNFSVRETPGPRRTKAMAHIELQSKKVNGDGTHRVLTGRGIANSRATVAVRIERAVRTKHGEIEVQDFTDKQLADLYRVPLSTLRKTFKNGNGGTVHEPTDAQVDRAIARLGPERVMAALDRLTQPSLFEAE
jgi:hypothetical protein